MRFTRSDLKYYRLRKIPSLKGVTDYRDNTITIHQVINDKVNYDPFKIKTCGTTKHNLFNSMYRKYKEFLKYGIEDHRTEFINFLGKYDKLKKYQKRFK